MSALDIPRLLGRVRGGLLLTNWGGSHTSICSKVTFVCAVRAEAVQNLMEKGAVLHAFAYFATSYKTGSQPTC